MLTGLVGVTAAMIYAFVSIAGMAETESVPERPRDGIKPCPVRGRY